MADQLVERPLLGLGALRERSLIEAGSDPRHISGLLAQTYDQLAVRFVFIGMGMMRGHTFYLTPAARQRLQGFGDGLEANETGCITAFDGEKRHEAVVENGFGRFFRQQRLGAWLQMRFAVRAVHVKRQSIDFADLAGAQIPSRFRESLAEQAGARQTRIRPEIILVPVRSAELFEGEVLGGAGLPPIWKAQQKSRKREAHPGSQRQAPQHGPRFEIRGAPVARLRRLAERLA